MIDASVTKPAEMRHKEAQTLGFHVVDHAIPGAEAVRKSVRSSYSIWAKGVRARSIGSPTKLRSVKGKIEQRNPILFETRAALVWKDSRVSQDAMEILVT